ncbi:extradiol ring-cleavage dioxygenase [Solimonas sp. K1W22B-7]|uniref:VOC family protein n=1 Tax=Solimonas sp. K1W22B-7 TaxID=2303331 RepID=UPI000E331F2E|nr:VOC family protein [Solimonas sp. K1W22B-7]AXQ27928.1 extradiol ring-cleavage dioxygenase [Solimonas sp. K1W22B-7]
MTEKHPHSLFGAVRMGYVLIESEKIDEWRRLLKQGLGMHLAHEDSATLAFRVDEHARRVIVARGPSEDFAAAGLQVDDGQALGVIMGRLRDRGIAVEAGTEEESTLRGVKSFYRFKGPKGMALELYTEPLLADEPLNMLTSAFVTGASGLGHLAITTRLPEKMLRFWQEIFDARLSDRISQPMGGAMLDISFLRLNERHHSIAIAATRGLRIDPIRTKAQHFNLLAATMDDLVNAYGRLRDLGCEMAHEIGQHPNDREVSFYVLTPSGFELELGWDALKVEEAGWKPTAHYNAISLWGHRPQRASLLRGIGTHLGNAVRGAKNALRPEYSPIR